MTIVPPQTARGRDAQPLLEREALLDALGAGLAAARAGSGSVFLVAGEAGVGKTTLVRRFCSECPPDVRVLEGACDALFTPRPLGPVADVAAQVGEPLAGLVAGGARAHDVLAALLDELRSRPTVLLLEDMHWADEATLDLLRLLGRRAQATSSLVLLTYRDDELAPAHPLRIVVGGLATTTGVARLQLEPLSVEAVGELAAPHGVDGQYLHTRTGGNPFFVTEVLGAGTDEVPPTVRDAVLARAARLSPCARRLLEAVSVVPASAELWLLDAVASPDQLGALDECLASGMVRGHGTEIAFRHELARLAVEASTPAGRRRELHRALLAALASPPDGAADPARLAHHAEAAGDGDAVLEHACAAAERAAASGAHREAAAQYGRALRHARDIDDLRLADLLDRHAHECVLTGAVAEALDSRKKALRLYQELGDELRRARSCGTCPASTGTTAPAPSPTRRPQQRSRCWSAFRPDRSSPPPTRRWRGGARSRSTPRARWIGVSARSRSRRSLESTRRQRAR